MYPSVWEFAGWGGEMGGHPVLLRRAAAAWEHMAGPGIISSTPPPALPKALTQQSGFHAVLSEPPSSSAISHWLLPLKLSSSWACLQEIPDLPKLAAEGGCMGGEAPSCFSFPVCVWPSLAMAFTSPLCCQWGATQACHTRDRISQLKRKCLCVCVCVQVEPGLTAGHFPADVGLGAALGPSAASHLAGAAGASCRAAQPPPERSCLCTLAGQRSQKLRFHCKHLDKCEVGTSNGKDR